MEDKKNRKPDRGELKLVAVCSTIATMYGAWRYEGDGLVGFLTGILVGLMFMIFILGYFIGFARQWKYYELTKYRKDTSNG
jgi:hypothetical protein